MKKNRITRAVLTFLIIVGISLIIPITSSAKTIELSYAGHHGPTDIHSKLMGEWIKEVETRTEGRVKINFYPGQSLVKAPQTYDAVINEMADIGFAIFSYTRGRFPLMDFINLPLGYTSAPVNTAIINEVWEKFKPAELSDVKVLYLHANPPSFINTVKDPIKTMADIKGLKVRSNGPTAEMIKELGGTPVALPMPELYQALQKGVVQGAIYDFTAAVDWKLAEVSEYTIVNSPTGVSLGFFNVMNKSKWDSIDPADQKIIDELNVEWAKKHGQAWQQSADRGAEFIKAQGKTVINIDPAEGAKWREAVQPVIDTYVKTLESKGLPGKDVLEYVQKRLDDQKAGTFESKYMMK